MVNERATIANVNFQLLNSLNDGKNGEGPSDGNLKKKENMGTGHVVRGQNNEVIEYVTEDGISYKISG